MADLQARRVELRRSIAAERSAASVDVTAIRNELGAAVLAFSVSRLIGGRSRLRTVAGLAGGALVFIVSRLLARRPPGGP
jgi:hypothetical protein